MDAGRGNGDDAFLMNKQLLDRTFTWVSLDRDIPLKLSAVKGGDPSLSRGEIGGIFGMVRLLTWSLPTQSSSCISSKATAVVVGGTACRPDAGTAMRVISSQSASISETDEAGVVDLW